MREKRLLIAMAMGLACAMGFSLDGVLEAPYLAKRAMVAPIIDADPSDPAWAGADWAPIDQVWIGAPTTPDDYQGFYKVVWTPERLYVLFKIERGSFNDKYANESGDMYNYECAEIFLDEDRSGGNHQRDYGAFSYHMTTGNNVFDHGPGGQGTLSFNDHVKLAFRKAEGTTYYWETEVKVYPKGFVYGGKKNKELRLSAGKEMGFSVAYNTNNGGRTRRNMFGSHYLKGPDKNTSWITASDFGLLILTAEEVGAPRN